MGQIDNFFKISLMIAKYNSLSKFIQNERGLQMTGKHRKLEALPGSTTLAMLAKLPPVDGEVVSRMQQQSVKKPLPNRRAPASAATLSIEAPSAAAPAAAAATPSTTTVLGKVVLPAGTTEGSAKLRAATKSGKPSDAKRTGNTPADLRKDAERYLEKSLAEAAKALEAKKQDGGSISFYRRIKNNSPAASVDTARRPTTPLAPISFTKKKTHLG